MEGVGSESLKGVDVRLPRRELPRTESIGDALRGDGMSSGAVIRPHDLVSGDNDDLVGRVPEIKDLGTAGRGSGGRCVREHSEEDDESGSKPQFRPRHPALTPLSARRGRRSHHQRALLASGVYVGAFSPVEGRHHATRTSTEPAYEGCCVTCVTSVHNCGTHYCGPYEKGL